MDGPTVKLKLLESILVGIPVNTESKALTRELNPLDSVFTKIWGRGPKYPPVVSGHLLRLLGGRGPQAQV